MSFLGRIGPRGRGAPPPAPAAPETRGLTIGPSALLERRDRLTREFAALQADLGGLAYEMAVRDHFRLDVLVRHAARLQEVDAELGEVERLVRLEDAGAAGTCPTCGALHSRGAVFCWQCGTELMPRTAQGDASDPTVVEPPEQDGSSGGTRRTGEPAA